MLTIEPTTPSLLTPTPTASPMVDNTIDDSRQLSGTRSDAASDGSASSDESTTSSEDELEEVDDGPLFTCFKKLPLELRRKIWKYACCVSRLIDLWAVPVYTANSEEWFLDNFGSVGPLVFKSHSRPPAVLHTSKESRAIGLESYSLEFGDEMKRQINGATFKVSIPNTIYVNWQSDIICPMPTNYRTGDRLKPFTTKHWNQTFYDFMTENRPYKYDLRLRKTQRLALAYDNLGAFHWNEWLLPSCQISEIILYSHTMDFRYLPFYLVARIELSEADVDGDVTGNWRYAKLEKQKLQRAQLDLREKLQGLVEKHNSSVYRGQEDKVVDGLTPPAVKCASLEIDLL